MKLQNQMHEVERRFFESDLEVIERVALEIAENEGMTYVNSYDIRKQLGAPRENPDFDYRYFVAKFVDADDTEKSINIRTFMNRSIENNFENIDEVRDALYNMLDEFDRKPCEHDRDIYAYYDAENKKVKLDYFLNVGGNSWLDDNHIMLYTCKANYDFDPIDEYQETEDFCKILGIDEEQMINETYEYHHENDEYFELDDVNFYYVKDYVINNQEYVEKICKYYYDYLDNSEYISETVDELMEKLQDEIISIMYDSEEMI